MGRDAALQRLGEALVQRADEDRPEWKELAITVSVEQDMTELAGFSYDGSGKAEPAVYGDPAMFEAIEDLRDSMAKADRKAPWVAALLHVIRTSGEVSGQFEYSDPRRWRIDLADMGASADRLRAH